MSVNRAEWKKRDGLLNMWEYEVTGWAHTCNRSGNHPYREETVLALSLSSPFSAQLSFSLVPGLLILCNIEAGSV